MKPVVLVHGANMDRIVDEHLVGGRVVEELVFHRGPQCGDAGETAEADPAGEATP